MIIGIPKEIKNHEYRVGVTPAGAKILTDAGHQVHIETGAGVAIGFSDAHYAAAGARIVDTARDVYACPMVIKVKEPQTSEYPLLHEGQLLTEADSTLACVDGQGKVRPLPDFLQQPKED